MAYLHGGKIIQWPSKSYLGHPGWLNVDCGCCNGIEWGGEFPQDCRVCRGDGAIALHVKSGMLALYPGGPFCGREPPDGQQSI